MGACCAQHGGPSSIGELLFTDEVTTAEKDLGLETMLIGQWAAVFKELIEKPEVSLEELAASFPQNCEFAKRLKGDLDGLPHRDQADSIGVQLLQHPNFKGRSGKGIDTKKAFALGFLYCKGKAEQHVDAIFEVYDKNGDGSLFVNSFRKIIKQVVFTALCIMPQLVFKLDPDTAEEKTYDDVEAISGELVVKVFGDELQRNIMVIVGAWKKENVGSLLTNPTKLRARATVKLAREENSLVGDGDSLAAA